VHIDILSPAQKDILPRLSHALRGTDFYMAGGTALALQVGHRFSIDFDWFAKEIGEPELLLQRLQAAQLNFTVLSVRFETVYLDIKTVQASFIGYNYPMLQPPVLWTEYGIYLAQIDDIACMKLSAITNRGSRKDFFDLFYIINNFKTLDLYLELFIKKYQQKDIGHVLRSLVYFEDAEQEPEPKMTVKISWKQLKKEFEHLVKKHS
jgi:predicted nucleotidyltransferase component of viral defense system